MSDDRIGISMSLSVYKSILQSKGVVTIPVKVVTNANVTEWREQMDDGILKLAIKAIPEAGKANSEIVLFIARAFNVSKDEVEIVRGKTNSRKEIKITE